MKISMSMLRRMIIEAIEKEIDESSREDLNDDGKNDFTDVMIARMKASGMPRGVAVKRGEKAARNASRRK